MGFTPIFGPIHELGHLAIDETAKMIGWARTSVSWDINHVYAGTIAEIIFWSIWAALWSIYGKRIGWACLFGVGHTLGAWVSLWVQKDFHEYLPALLSHYHVANSEAVMATMALRWIYVGPVWFTGPFLLVWYAYRERTK